MKPLDLKCRTRLDTGSQAYNSTRGFWLSGIGSLCELQYSATYIRANPWRKETIQRF